ncbi:MAG: tRNA lysidine(34) synthetase TilS, partial [Saprospiraceae bacterium]|nr:tRNA lysidine(34) synthetase TilS [Saprospiraceae bacterium]
LPLALCLLTQPMLQDFQKFVRENGLFQKKDRILLAVSGGVDSVVMANLFWESGVAMGIAHCNFQLRGAASEADATLVEKLAGELEAPFHLTHFETTRTASKGGISIQMAARQLRYEWLEQQRITGNYDAIATAHHLDDSIETLLYNFAKGCGLHGLHGIPVRQGKIIRPMLFAHKEAIIHYAEAGAIASREDQSNKEDKYARNYIRQHVIPALEAINPAFRETAASNIRRLKEAEYLMDWAVAQLKKDLTETDSEGRLRINLERLRQEKAAPTLLYEWLKPYGFHAASLARLLHSTARTGAMLCGPAHRLLLNRGILLLDFLPDPESETMLHIAPGTPEVILPGGRFEFKTGLPPDVFGKNNNIAYLNLAPTDYPLRLRHWQPGDTFQPLGMQGKQQKIQDLFSNLKLSRFEKSTVWLLETADGRICWVAGLRTDERFRIQSKTAHCAKIEWIRQV